MRTLYNGLILGAWAACVLAALVAFGGVVADFALPFYLAAAALAVVWALKLFTVRGQTMPWTPLHVPVLALFLYVALRAFTAPLRHDAQWELLRAGVYTLIYFAAAFNFHRSRYRAVVLTVLVVAAVLESLYGYWQYATRTDKVFLFPRDEQYRGRASGTYICPNHLAGWLEVLALVVLAQLLVNRRPLASLEHSVIVKFLEVTALGAILVGLVSTGSRGGWFALAIGATVLWLWAWQTQLIPPRVADAMMVLLVLAFAGMLAIPAVRERVWEVLSVNFGYAFEYGVVRLTDPGLAGRAAMTAACWQMFCEHPWVGVGPGAWRWFEAEYRQIFLPFRPQYAHNDLFQFAAEYGAVGLVLLTAALVCFFWRALQLTRRAKSSGLRAIGLGSASAVTAMLVHSLVDFNMHIPSNALLIATLVGLTAGLNSEERSRRGVATTARFAIAVLVLAAAGFIAWTAYRLCVAHRHVSAGRAAQAARLWTEAMSRYQRAAALAPAWHEPCARLGDVWHLQRNPAAVTNAISAYHRSLQLNARDPNVLLGLALAHEQLHQTNQAFRVFREIFLLAPQDGDYWFEYGRFLERTGNVKHALRAYWQAVRLHHPAAGYHVRRLQQQ